ncbi:hypothetical protein [Streptomyces sp. NPDC006012]|uniref:hypothetical protein n=1 Tax=Streptomyces sp. NPDC006012 TaxID=3364739 RepID=UPI0036D0A378
MKISDAQLTVELDAREVGKLPTQKYPFIDVKVDGSLEYFSLRGWLDNQLYRGRKDAYSPGLTKALKKHGYEPEQFEDMWKLRRLQENQDRGRTGTSRSERGESSRAPEDVQPSAGFPGRSGPADVPLNPAYGHGVGVGTQGHVMPHAEDDSFFEEESRKLALEVMVEVPDWPVLLPSAIAQGYLPQQDFNGMPVSSGNYQAALAVPAVPPGPVDDFGYPSGPGPQGGLAQPYGNSGQAQIAMGSGQAETVMGYGRSGLPDNPVGGYASRTQPPLGSAGRFGTHGADLNTADRGWTGRQASPRGNAPTP